MLDEVGGEGGFCRAGDLLRHAAGLPRWGSLIWSATVPELRRLAQREAPVHLT